MKGQRAIRDAVQNSTLFGMWLIVPKKQKPTPVSRGRLWSLC